MNRAQCARLPRGASPSVRGRSGCEPRAQAWRSRLACPPSPWPPAHGRRRAHRGGGGGRVGRPR
eukprot:scaffold231017_cov36-Tisochrysis_lutea.AAC.1